MEGEEVEEGEGMKEQEQEEGTADWHPPALVTTD